MPEVKWIKITTDIFDDEKILLIESLPEADAIIVIWFKLLCLAGKQNNSGVFMMNDKIPFTEKMLATIFRRKEATVQLALRTFEEFGMVEIVDGVITIPKWGKHQSIDKLEERKAYMREYMSEYRKKQALLADGKQSKVNGKANSKANVSALEEELDKEEELELEIDKERRTDYKSIVTMYNEVCTSFPKVTALSDARKKAISARLKSYTIDDFKTVFEKAEASSFLKGGNNRNWTATFDWMLKDTNFAKILDGNYDGQAQQKPKLSKAAQDLEDAYDMIAKWAAKGDD